MFQRKAADGEREKAGEPADWRLDSCHHFHKRPFAAAAGKQKECFIGVLVSAIVSALPSKVNLSAQMFCYRLHCL